ncbi:MAG: phosphatase PAP2 family protein [Alphaproteobacteria bacterium]
MKKLSLLFLFTTLFFLFFPEIDLKLANITYDAAKGFIWIDQKFFRLVYKSLYVIVPGLTIIFFCAIILTLLFKRYCYLKKSIYLLLCFAIGPGLIVNVAFKENFGRARPAQIKQYGGDKNFTKIFQITNQCQKNCSFTSGHAAVGFYFSAFSYIIKTNRIKKFIIIMSILLGSILGLARILQGAHFISDIVFSGIIVNLVNCYISKFFNKD